MMLGERVRDTREECDLSQTALAKLISKASGETINQQSIAQLESGQVQNPRYLIELSRVLGVNPDWLKTGKGAKKPETSVREAPAAYAAIDSKKMADILDAIQQIEQSEHMEFSSAQKAGLIRQLYARPGNVDYRAEAENIIELSKVLRRT